MALKSKLFSGDRVFEAALVNDAAHIKLGAQGDHVGKIHTALFVIDRISVSSDELHGQEYGSSTASGVFRFKKKRNIVNHAYQSSADDVVGKMTVAALDQDMAHAENAPNRRRAMIVSATMREKS